MVDFGNPSKLVRKEVPNDVLRDLAYGVWEAYARKDEFQPFFALPQMHDAWPIIRRGLIETAFGKIARMHPSLKHSDCRNPAGTSHYVRLDVGPIVIIQAKVDWVDDIPRPALHREDLAQTNASFLVGMEDLAPPVTDATKLCAMIIHSPDPDQPDRPTFIDMVFPTPNGKGYLGERLHLLPELDLIEARPKAEEEKVADDLPIEFRKDIAREDTA